jgi:hypothetical protein
MLLNEHLTPVAARCGRCDREFFSQSSCVDLPPYDRQYMSIGDPFRSIYDFGPERRTAADHCFCPRLPGRGCGLHLIYRRRDNLCIRKRRRVDYEIALGRSTREIDPRGCRRVERTGRLNRRCDSLSGYHRDRRALPARIASPWGWSKYLTSFVSSANSAFCSTVRLAIH